MVVCKDHAADSAEREVVVSDHAAHCAERMLHGTAHVFRGAQRVLITPYHAANDAEEKDGRVAPKSCRRSPCAFDSDFGIFVLSTSKKTPKSCLKSSHDFGATSTRLTSGPPADPRDFDEAQIRAERRDPGLPADNFVSNRENGIDRGGGGEVAFNDMGSKLKSIGLSTILGLLLAYAPASSARSQALTSDQVSSWIASEVSSCAGLPVLGDHSISWRVEQWWVPTLAELNLLRSEVANKPDHPRKADLEQYDNALRKTPTTKKYRLWSKGPGKWRLCMNWGRLGDTEQYWDKTLTDQVAWTLLQSQLEVADPREPSRPGMNLHMIERSFGSDIEEFFSGRMCSVARSKYEFGRPLVESMRWSVSAARGGGTAGSQRIEVSFSGRWEPEHQRGFVEQIRVVRNDLQPDSVGERTVFSDWRQVGEVDRWISHRVERFRGDGSLDRVLVFERVHTGSPGEFDDVTRVPPIDGQDAIRGKSEFRFVTDHRSGAQSAVDEQRREVAQAAIPGKPASASSAWNRWIGRSVTGVLVLCLVGVVIRRYTLAR